MKPTAVLLLVSLLAVSLAGASEKKDYLAACKAGTIEAYEQFLAKYPNSRRKNDVRYSIGKIAGEDMLWRRIQQAPTQDLIDEYKSRFFDGKHLAEVTGKYQQEVDDKLRPKKEEIQEVQASRPATDAEVSAMNAEIQRRISPFTLDEVRGGGGGMKVADRNGKQVTVTVQTITAGDFVRSDFFAKEGANGISLADSLRGDVGEHVLTLRRKAGASETITLPDGDAMYSEFQQAADGKWTVRKFRVVEH